MLIAQFFFVVTSHNRGCVAIHFELVGVLNCNPSTDPMIPLNPNVNY
jgi:hypothetical protein